jgi:heptosyltransferase III
VKPTAPPDQFNLRRFMVKALLLCIGAVRPKAVPVAPFRAIIILAQEKLGDAILLTPLPRLLKSALPTTTIHVVTFGKNREFYEADPHIDNVFSVKPKLFATLQAIRRLRYDVLINTKDHPSFSYLLLTRLIRTNFRLGISHPYHKGFFNYCITIDFHRHVIEKNCAFLTALKIPFATSTCRPQLPPVPASNRIKKFAAHLRSIPQPRIGINLSAGENDREWPLEKWRELLMHFSNARFAIFAMPDKKDSKVVLESSFSHCIPTPETATIFDVAEILKHLDLLITPDTSFIHLCTCLSIPVVALFRSHLNHMSHFSPYQVPHRMVISSTMLVQDIPVAPVITAVNELLPNPFPVQDQKHGQ